MKAVEWGRRRDWVQEDSWELLGPGGLLPEIGLFWLLDSPCKVAWCWATGELKGVRMYLGNWGQIHWLPRFPGLPECVLGIRLCWGVMCVCVCGAGESKQRELETKDCQKDRQVLGNQKREQKAAEQCGRCETCTWWGGGGGGWGGGEAGEATGGGPAWALRLQLGGGGWFRVSRRKAEEG